MKKFLPTTTHLIEARAQIAQYPELAAFLTNPTEKNATVFLDTEGAPNLSKNANICVVQVCMRHANNNALHVYLFDIVKGGYELITQDLSVVLASKAVLKVIHDCRRDSEALFYCNNSKVQLDHVFDTSVAHSELQVCESQMCMGGITEAHTQFLFSVIHAAISRIDARNEKSVLPTAIKYWTPQSRNNVQFCKGIACALVQQCQLRNDVTALKSMVNLSTALMDLTDQPKARKGFSTSLRTYFLNALSAFSSANFVNIDDEFLEFEMKQRKQALYMFAMYAVQQDLIPKNLFAEVLSLLVLPQDGEILQTCLGTCISKLDAETFTSLKKQLDGCNVSFASLLPHTTATDTITEEKEEEFAPDGVRELYKEISLVHMLKQLVGIDYSDKDSIKMAIRADEMLWSKRPLSQDFIEHASNDVSYLYYLYQALQYRIQMLKPHDQDLIESIITKSSLSAVAYRSFVDHPYTFLSQDSVSDTSFLLDTFESTCPDLIKSRPMVSIEQVERGDQVLTVISNHENSMGRMLGKHAYVLFELRAQFPSIFIFTPGKQGPLNRIFMVGHKQDVLQAIAYLPKRVGLFIPHDKVGQVIGKQGRNVDRIQTESKCNAISLKKVELVGIKNADALDGKWLIVSGTDHQIKDAMKQIDKSLKFVPKPRNTARGGEQQ